MIGTESLTDTGTMTLGEIADELDWRFRTAYEVKWPGEIQPRAEVANSAVIMHYRGHYTRLTRADALRVLDFLAEATPRSDDAIHEEITSNA